MAVQVPDVVVGAPVPRAKSKLLQLTGHGGIHAARRAAAGLRVVTAIAISSHHVPRAAFAGPLGERTGRPRTHPSHDALRTDILHRENSRIRRIPRGTCGYVVEVLAAPASGDERRLRSVLVRGPHADRARGSRRDASVFVLAGTRTHATVIARRHSAMPGDLRHSPHHRHVVEPDPEHAAVGGPGVNRVLQEVRLPRASRSLRRSIMRVS